jgi:hypothetical protein
MLRCLGSGSDQVFGRGDRYRRQDLSSIQLISAFAARQHPVMGQIAVAENPTK